MATPAWMLCQDLIVRIREEFVSETIETLDEEVKAGRMNIVGKLVTSEEGMEDAERKLFVINNIAEQIGAINREYHEYVDNAIAGGKDAAKIDEFRKFLLAASKIAMLVGYNRALGDWLEDTGMRMRDASVEWILEMTVDSEIRMEVLEFVVMDRKVLGSGLFTEAEISAMRKAIDSYKKRSGI